MTRRLHGLERRGADYLSPRDVQAPERVHAEAFEVDPDCFSSRAENVLL
jgi:hypothetical protein